MSGTVIGRRFPVPLEAAMPDTLVLFPRSVCCYSRRPTVRARGLCGTARRWVTPVRIACACADKTLLKSWEITTRARVLPSPRKKLPGRMATRTPIAAERA